MRNDVKSLRNESDEYSDNTFTGDIQSRNDGVLFSCGRIKQSTDMVVNEVYGWRPGAKNLTGVHPTLQ